MVNLVKLAEEAFKEHGIGSEHEVLVSRNYVNSTNYLEYEEFKKLADIEVNPDIVSNSFHFLISLWKGEKREECEFQGVLRINKKYEDYQGIFYGSPPSPILKEIKFIWLSKEDYSKEVKEVEAIKSKNEKIDKLIELGILENRG